MWEEEEMRAVIHRNPQTALGGHAEVHGAVGQVAACGPS